MVPTRTKRAIREQIGLRKSAMRELRSEISRLRGVSEKVLEGTSDVDTRIADATREIEKLDAEKRSLRAELIKLSRVQGWSLRGYNREKALHDFREAIPHQYPSFVSGGSPSLGKRS